MRCNVSNRRPSDEGDLRRLSFTNRCRRHPAEVLCLPSIGSRCLWHCILSYPTIMTCLDAATPPRQGDLCSAAPPVTPTATTREGEGLWFPGRWNDFRKFLKKGSVMHRSRQPRVKVGRGDCHRGGRSRRDTGGGAPSAFSWPVAIPQDRHKGPPELSNQDQEAKAQQFNFNIYTKSNLLLAPLETLQRFMVWQVTNVRVNCQVFGLRQLHCRFQGA